jgi:single-strand DNA-binding protein
MTYSAKQLFIINFLNLHIMSTLKNKVTLVGNAGQQPEVKTVGNNKTVVNFSMATRESRKNPDGQWVDETQWHNLTAWGTTAEFIARNIQKGQMFMVEGKLLYNNYNAQDGTKRYTTEILVEQVELVGKKINTNA